VSALPCEPRADLALEALRQLVVGRHWRESTRRVAHGWLDRWRAIARSVTFASKLTARSAARVCGFSFSTFSAISLLTVSRPLHVAVAWYQAGRGNEVGCERQLEKALRRLGPYAPAHRGLDVEALLASVEAARGRFPDLPPPALRAP
jgi:hypothetical protein